MLPFIQVGLQNVLQYIHELDAADSTSPSTWDHVEAEFMFTGNTDNADRWFTTWDVINITGGGVDSSWTQGDFDAVDGHLRDFCFEYLTLAPQQVQFVGTKHYLRSFTPLPTAPLPPDERDKPFTRSGPPSAVYPQTRVGSGLAEPLPPQISVSVTEKTPYPRHWGRNYFPQLAANQFTSSGHISSTACTTLANAAGVAYAALQAQEFFPVVPVVQIDKQPARALLQVNSLQVDNVPDVIRRRRPHQTTFRATAP